MSQRPTFFINLMFDKAQAPRDVLMSRVRDFGETVFYDLRHERRLQFDFDVIDAAWDSFYFSATSEILARRAAKRVEELLPQSNLVAVVTVSRRPSV